jgi:hypothetical protein
VLERRVRLAPAPARDVARAHAGQQLVQHDAQRIDVGRGRHRVAAQLFRRGIVRGQQLRLGRVLVAGGEQLGDAEVEQFRRAVGGDEDVRRLQVAVHDQVLVRVLHRIADRREQAQAGAQVQFPFTAVVGDRPSLDVFQDEVGNARRRQAAVDQARDVRVLQMREDLPFLAEALQQAEGGVGQQFDRDALFEMAVGALGQQHDAHAAAPEFAHDAPHADAVAERDARFDLVLPAPGCRRAVSTPRSKAV